MGPLMSHILLAHAVNLHQLGDSRPVPLPHKAAQSHPMTGAADTLAYCTLVARRSGHCRLHRVWVAVKVTSAPQQTGTTWVRACGRVRMPACMHAGAWWWEAAGTVLSAEPVASTYSLKGLNARQLTSAVCASDACTTPAPAAAAQSEIFTTAPA